VGSRQRLLTRGSTAKQRCRGCEIGQLRPESVRGLAECGQDLLDDVNGHIANRFAAVFPLNEICLGELRQVGVGEQQHELMAVGLQFLGQTIGEVFEWDGFALGFPGP